MTFLLILLAFMFLGWLLPRLMVWIARRKLTSMAEQMRRQAEAAFGDGRQGGRQEQRRPEAKARRKKIGADVGEYVRFEELTEEAETTVSDTDGGRRTETHVSVEEQVVDVEWEDLPKQEDEKQI